MKPLLVTTIHTFADLKAALESLSEDELKQPVRFLDTKYGIDEVYRVFELAADEVGLILTE